MGKAGKAEIRVKITASLPVALVKAGKIAAIERDMDFQDLLAEGLRLALGRTKGG